MTINGERWCLVFLALACFLATANANVSANGTPHGIMVTKHGVDYPSMDPQALPTQKGRGGAKIAEDFSTYFGWGSPTSEFFGDDDDSSSPGSSASSPSSPTSPSSDNSSPTSSPSSSSSSSYSLSSEHTAWTVISVFILGFFVILLPIGAIALLFWACYKGSREDAAYISMYNMTDA